MTESDKTKSFAVLIAIETYRFSDEHGINNVEYARNDVEKMKSTLMESLGLKEDEIIVWIDNEANKTALENELKYYVSQLDSETKFYFYYAGHGFYQSGTNKITCWDSHPTSLDTTTVSLKEILFDPLEKSECTESIIFLDTCASHLKGISDARDFIANFNSQEFEEYLTDKNYNAIFMSCSPGEKSYPSNLLKHGIWTYHLTEAIKGNAKEALVKDEFLTDASLKNYLSFIVPKFMTDKTTIKGVQNPFAKIHSGGDFLINKIERIEEVVAGTPKIRLDFENPLLRKITEQNIKHATGFKKSHFKPKDFSSSSKAFIQNVFTPDLEEEIQEVYTAAKAILSLKRRDIQYGVDEGKGSVDCSYFRYSVLIEQDEAEPDKAIVTRILQIRERRPNLPENFDDIFPHQIDEIIFDIVEQIEFDDLVDKFENLVELNGGVLEDNEMNGTVTYETPNGILMFVDLNDDTISISPQKSMKCLQLIDSTMESLGQISQGKPKLLK